ncbi:MAG: hypothetical protein CMC77_04010 [Flavobacteriaceae bacterium]|nr:hypothetical protein [Flavobacteriaceae bacterium]|tara:strand:- start:5297 stop:6115 length:819 start_codon:yes stop_codon:yes gene_type:complete
MNLMENAHIDFEILISTQSQTSLDFLVPMFKNQNYKDFNLLIVNQNFGSVDLVSEYKNIRVFNSPEKGLAKSRNIAIKNALGTVCLFADDDVVYEKDFKEKIMSSHRIRPGSDIITFKMKDFNGNDFRDYPKHKLHDKKSLATANAVVISFKKQAIQNHVFFDTLFGLGSEFPTGDEYIFLRAALNKGKIITFEPTVILKHPDFSSGQAVTKDYILYARAALFYKFEGALAYIKLLKHLLMLVYKRQLSLVEVCAKYKVGLKGISRFKQLMP